MWQPLPGQEDGQRPLVVGHREGVRRRHRSQVGQLAEALAVRRREANPGQVDRQQDGCADAAGSPSDGFDGQRRPRLKGEDAAAGAGET